MLFNFGSVFGRNPENRNLSVGSPEPAKAVMAALGPGKATTSMFCSRQARINRNPGSEIPGIPASLTRQATSFFSFSIKIFNTSRSLWSANCLTAFLGRLSRPRSLWV